MKLEAPARSCVAARSLKFGPLPWPRGLHFRIILKWSNHISQNASRTLVAVTADLTPDPQSMYLPVLYGSCCGSGLKLDPRTIETELTTSGKLPRLVCIIRTSFNASQRPMDQGSRWTSRALERPPITRKDYYSSQY